MIIKLGIRGRVRTPKFAVTMIESFDVTLSFICCYEARMLFQ